MESSSPPPILNTAAAAGQNAAPTSGGFAWASGRAILTVSEVAEACGVSAKTVGRWIAHESLPCVRLRGAGAREMVFVRPIDLDAWLLKARSSPAESEADDRTMTLEGWRFVDRGRKKSRRSA